MVMALGFWRLKVEETKYIKQTKHYFHIAGRDRFRAALIKLIYRRKWETMEKLIHVGLPTSCSFPHRSVEGRSTDGVCFNPHRKLHGRSGRNGTVKCDTFKGSTGGGKVSQPRRLFNAYGHDEGLHCCLLVIIQQAISGSSVCMMLNRIVVSWPISS